MIDHQSSFRASVYSPRFVVNSHRRFASFKRGVLEHDFPLEYWAGFMALRVPGLDPDTVGLNQRYMANVRRELKERGLLHFFRLGPNQGTCVVTASVPTDRNYAKQLAAHRHRVVPLEELPDDQFTISVNVWERCLEVYQARFGKSVFGAYCVLAEQDKAKWTAVELTEIWGVSQATTYRLIEALKTLGRLVKRKRQSCYEFIPEKAYRAAFTARTKSREESQTLQENSQELGVVDNGENSQSREDDGFVKKPLIPSAPENPVELLHRHFSSIKNARVSVPTLTPRRRVYRCDNETYSLLLHPESPFSRDVETIISRCKETSLGELKFVLSGLERRLRRSTINTDDLRIIARYLEKDELRQFRLGRLLDLAFWRNVVFVCKKRETEQISRERYFAPEVLDTDPHSAITVFETARRSFGSGTGCISAARNGGTFFAALLVAFGLDAEEELAILRADITNHELISDITGIGATWVLAQQVPELAVKFTGLSWEELCELREKEVARAEFVTSHDENFYAAPYEEVCEAA